MTVVVLCVEVVKEREASKTAAQKFGLTCRTTRVWRRQVTEGASSLFGRVLPF